MKLLPRQRYNDPTIGVAINLVLDRIDHKLDEWANRQLEIDHDRACPKVVHGQDCGCFLQGARGVVRKLREDVRMSDRFRLNIGDHVMRRDEQGALWRGQVVKREIQRLQGAPIYWVDWNDDDGPSLMYHQSELTKDKTAHQQPGPMMTRLARLRRWLRKWP